MGDTIKSYRVKANVGADSFLSVNLEQDYDIIDILSLRIDSQDLYRLHNSNYGVVVGRVLANNGFGIPNAKISVFIGKDSGDDEKMLAIYPYSSPASKDENGVRYNLLPDEKVANCHQVVGTFPNKRYLLDNEDIIEVFDKYYRYTTRTNNAGDYIICGVPTGNQTLHMDLDLSDCGILSQRPRDFVYKGYTIEQFENPNMFKTGTSYSNLSQIFTQDQAVYVRPFWGNESLGEEIGITRADIDVAFKFEPTCVFMGSIASDPASQGISRKCIPTPHMGDMDELVTGSGTIEMIRKTYAGNVEEFQVKGTELINGNGIWCYQIPMNLDYMMTDEYGNMVPTDNPDKGIPTRTRVRFRISMQDFEQNTDNYFRPKVLVPHNPQNLNGTAHEDYDYEFGSFTSDESFRDLFWNEVYTVKSYIPRFQKRKVAGWKEKKFTGIKQCQNSGKNNPIPYNNIRIRLPFMFKVMCILIKIFIKIVKIVNTIISMIGNGLAEIGHIGIKALNWYPFDSLYDEALKLKMNVIDEGMCPDLENWYFSPVYGNPQWSPKKVPSGHKRYNLLKQTLESITTDDDPTSIDDQNQDTEDEAKCLTINTDYLISCIEMNLAQEYRVINFDFYNDWINGLIYIPRFMRYVRKKRKFLGITIVKAKVRGCMDDKKIFSRTRRYTQMCSLGYKKHSGLGNYSVFSKTETNLNNIFQIIKSNNFHKKKGLSQEKIFGKSNAGICHEKETMYGHHVYYLKPCEWLKKGTPANRKVNLYATDIVLLGSLNECDLYGIPQAFKHLTSSSYIMPTNLALTNMEEDGPLYAYGDNGTICSTINQTTEVTDVESLTNPVQVVSGTLTSQLNYYSGASSNYDVMYDDPSDTMPLTEAAGIAWNYTGPGQGEIDKKRLYYPGGHFLGLSCVNSQTNIKSCINLERICEAGATMSQRRENVRAVKTKEGEAVLEYTYDVPTGFISGDDIVDDEFRVMFATMNQKRLIAKKINPNTGYKVYDFAYVNPINFNGEFSKYAGNNTPYNSANGTKGSPDESASLKRFGIEPGESREDYDPDEYAYTKTRTIEFPSVDYYMFRFGLDYTDLTRSNAKHMRQFALEKDGLRYLPQYENSYYFYFGMKDGSTALDEFNKQFFSECESSTLIEREANAYMIVLDYDPCVGTSTVIPYLKNLDGQLTYRIDYGDNIAMRPGKDVTPLYGVWEDSNSAEPFDLPAGTYKFKVVDEEGTELTTEFTIGNGVVNTNTTAYDFNVSLVPPITQTVDTLVRTAANSNMYYGGYLKLEGTVLNVPEKNAVSQLYVRAVMDGDNPYQPRYGSENTGIDSLGNCELYLMRSNVTYDVYIHFKYNDGECENVEQDGTYIFLTSLNLLNPRLIDLRVGPVLKTPYRDLPIKLGSSNPDYLMQVPEWWKSADNAAWDNPYFWDVRKSVIKSNGTTAETHSNYVISVDGLRAVFGTPQNYREIKKGLRTFSTHEPEENIPNGFTVDDEDSYHETYAVPYVASVHPYNSISYKGYTIAGNYGAVVDGEGITKPVIGSGPGAASLRPGEGCLYKPLPDGDIVSAIYNGGSITCYGDVEGYTKGIVYPTITYPVVRKPLEVNANYFLLDNKHLIELEDEEVEILNASDGIKCEAHIYNGLTYNYYYGGDSFMPIVTETDLNEGLQDKIMLDRVNQRTGVGQSDLAGIFPDRLFNDGHGNETFLSGWTEEQIEDFSYFIQEGSPMYSNGVGHFSANKLDGCGDYEHTSAYKTLVTTSEITADVKFYDQAKYRVDNSGGLYFKFIGGSDSDIKYYVVSLSSLSALIKEDTDVNGYEWIKTGFRTYYLLGHYTSAATYDTDGEDVVVKLYDTFLDFQYPRAMIPFTKYKQEGDDNSVASVEFEEKRINVNGRPYPSERTIGKYAEQIAYEFGYRVVFDKKRIVIENDSDDPRTRMEFKDNSFTKIVKSAVNGGNLIDNLLFYAPSPVSDKNPKICVIGVKHIEDNGTATEDIYHIYMHPNRIYEVDKASIILLIYIDGVRTNNAVFGNYADSSQCMILVHPDYDLTNFVIHTDWVSASARFSDAGVVSGMNAFTTTIRVTTNDSSDERRTTIDVGATGRQGTTSEGLEERTQIAVRQTKGTKEVEEGLEDAQGKISDINDDIDDINEDISGIHETINNLPSGGGTQPTNPSTDPINEP